MTKITALRRFLLPCFSPSATSSAAPSSKIRLSTSLRDDLPDVTTPSPATSPPPSTSGASHPRASKSMVIGTIFGHRRGHVWFCVQLDRRSTRPALLLELSIPTHLLVAQMRSSGLVRIVLESDLATYPLRSIPAFSLLLDGRKVGSAARRRPGDAVRLMLKAMESITVGAGALPAGLGFGSESGSGSEGPVMYMRANYEHMIGSADAESFHLINPDQFPGQELSVFLLRSRNTAA